MNRRTFLLLPFAFSNLETDKLRARDDKRCAAIARRYRFPRRQSDLNAHECVFFNGRWVSGKVYAA